MQAGPTMRHLVQPMAYDQFDPLWETKSSTGVYSNLTIPTSGATVLTTNFYDDYNISGLPSTYTVTSGVSVMTRGLLIDRHGNCRRSKTMIFINWLLHLF